ncbi:hypothetical protein [Algivirga pacifica]|uniref:Uncharacterized protein n=1 Tax=Algivirga pacifica TaxID=1162670 RepID=A0ABP9D4P7_9BACT
MMRSFYLTGLFIGVMLSIGHANTRELSSLWQLFHQGEEALQDSLPVAIRGDQLLQQLCSTLEQEITDGHMQAEQEEVVALLSALHRLGYHVQIAEPDHSKLISYIIEGRWDYLWSRYESRIVQDLLGVTHPIGRPLMAVLLPIIIGVSCYVMMKYSLRACLEY